MKTTFKWIVGILATLLVLAILAGGAYLIYNRWFGDGDPIVARSFHAWEDGRSMPWRSMHPDTRLGFGNMWVFSPLRLIFGGLVNLGLIALVVLGVVYLVRGLGRPAGPVAPAPAAQPAPAAAPAAGLVCPDCAQPLQADWKHCPNCGRNLSA